MRHPWRSVALLPAMRIFLLLASGVFLQWHAPCERLALQAVALLGFAFSLTLLLLERRQASLGLPRDISLAILLVCCGMLRCDMALHSYAVDFLPFADLRDKVLLRGVVASHPRVAPDRQRFLLKATQVMHAGKRYEGEGNVMLSYSLSQYVQGDTLWPLRAGDTIEVRCRLRLPRKPCTPHGFDARNWVLQEGAVLQAAVSRGSDLRVLHSGNTHWWTDLIANLRDELRHAINALYHPSHAAVMQGLLLGDRGGIDADTLEDFRRAGIMHILAVSGLHAGIVLALVFVPLERLPFLLRVIASLGALWLFAAITGFAPPVTRASVMATVLLGGMLLQRQGSSINALAVAGVIIIVANPLSLFGLSFQLSFGAVLGILLFHDRIRNSIQTLIPKRFRGTVSDTVLSLLSLTIAAQTLTLPLLAGNFGQISIAGLATNLPTVPLVFVVVNCGLLSVLLFPLLQTPAHVLSETAGGALDLILLASEALASTPWGVIDIPAVPLSVGALYLAGIVYLSATPGRMRQKIVLLGVFLLAAFITGSVLSNSQPPRLRVSFLDVGQGDAILVEMPGSDPWLIDTGPGNPRGNSATRIILPHLRANGIRRLGALVITHPDNDHSGGAAAVLEGVQVDSVYLSCRWPGDGETGRLLELMGKRTRGVRDLRAGDRFAFGDHARVYVLSPPSGTTCTPSNDNSTVLLLVYGETRFLFMGDAETTTEREIIARYDTLLRANVLKVGHHGSTTSTSPGFAVKVRPAHAVIMAGRNNQFNHPRQEILERLRLIGAEIHRTDIEGTIVFESDGERVGKLEWTR
jgi:competence protein ComEC